MTVHMKKYLVKIDNGREVIKTNCVVCGELASRSGFCKRHRHKKVKRLKRKAA